MQTCRICENGQSNSRFEVREMMYGFRDNFEYFQCSSCGCLQIENVPADMDRYYPSGYYSFMEEEEISVFRRKITNLRNKFAIFDVGIVGGLLYKYRPKSQLRALARLSLNIDKRILDVGCGTGALLRSLQAAGFKNLQGIDPLIAEDINNINGLNIKKNELIDIEGIWDLVMFNHSFEHILNQLETLQHVRKILSDNGTCLIGIPVVSSFAWRHYGVNWVQLDAPRHFIIHSIQSMTLLAKRAGFLIEHVAFDSNDFQFWGSELYCKDISLIDPITLQSKPKAALFTVEELRKYSAEADRLNAAQDGDQVVFYLKKN